METKTIILGTAGHIDHGKTTLVKALTGVDTDRLKEEKERGITIELGFARLLLPSGQSVGVVDVPGHERFVKNMVAGASGMDLVALVVAADEGPMPQTREHLEICELLGVKKGLIVLTKKDMVDDEWLELVTEDVKDFVSGTFLEEAPIVAVSSTTGEGLDDLLGIMDALVSQVESRQPAGPYRLPVDRVFIKKGFGTVVTGTSLSGTIRVGDEAMVYPRGISTRIRTIQIHGEDKNEAKPGLRTALNLQGVDKDGLSRGDVVATPGSLHASYLLDLKLKYLSSAERPLKYRSPVRFHVGTAEVIGRVMLPGDEMKPGEESFIQIKLERPVAVLPGDRYVIRSYSPVRTIGGGKVLHPVPRRRKRTRPDLWKELVVLDRGEPQELVDYHLKQSGIRGLTLSELAMRSGIYGKSLNRVLDQLLGSRKVVRFEGEEKRFLQGDVYNSLKEKALSMLEAFHEKNPLLNGLPKEELRSRLFSGAGDPRLFQRLLSDLVKEGLLVQEKEVVRLPSHQVSLGEEETELRNRIISVYKKAGFSSPSRNEALENVGGGEAAERIFDLLVREGELVRVRESIFYHRSTLEQLKDMVVDFIKKHGQLTITDFRKLSGGLSRKYMIPLLEYLDNQRVTIRVGDARKLRG